VCENKFEKTCGFLKAKLVLLKDFNLNLIFSRVEGTDCEEEKVVFKEGETFSSVCILSLSVWFDFVVWSLFSVIGTSFGDSFEREGEKDELDSRKEFWLVVDFCI
jgi:hypothetical protein